MKNRKSVMAAVLVLLTGTVPAADQLPAGQFSLGDLERIQEQTLLSQARLEEARAKNELQTLLARQPQPATPMQEQQTLSPANNGSAPAQTLVVPSADQHRSVSSSLPGVEQIWGNSHHLRAKLKLADGATMIAGPDSQLAADGLRVVTITPHHVLVAREHGKAFALPFFGGEND